MPKCEHKNFSANVDVIRLTEADGEAVKGYTADIRIRCAECDLPFEFVGLTCGSSPVRPMVDASAQELRAPIKPKGSLLLPGIPGFTVRAN